jgi:hypothetical protein
MRRGTRRIIRYETKLSADEVQARLQKAVDPPGIGARAWRMLRQPDTSDFYGVIDPRSFWIRRWNQNTWKPTARGRIDASDAGSVVSVEIEQPNTSWFVPTVVVVWVLALVGASLSYGRLPPGDLLMGGTAIALFGVGLGLVGPRIAVHERDQIEALLSHVLDCQGMEAPSS